MTRLHRLLPLCLATLSLPAMAAPQSLDDWRDQRPDSVDTWTLSQLIGDDVIAGENSEVGEVDDVILDTDGNIQSLVVYSNGNHAERGYRQVDWPVEVFEPFDPTLSIAEKPDAFAKQQVQDSAAALAGDEQFLASRLLGMGVQVEGAPYAEVEGLIVDADDQVSSVVIDPDGLDTADYWIPTDLGWINPEWAMIVPYGKSEVESAGSYQDGDENAS